MSHSQRNSLWPVLLACYFASGMNQCRAADLTEIVQRATAALNSDWAADLLYACKQRDETQKGGKLTSKTFEVLMIDGSDYHFPLAADDQPLPADRQRAELAKLANEVRKRQSESASVRKTRVETWKKRRDESGELLLDFPTALTFQLLGEETRNGRATWVLSATPRPGIVPTTRAAKVLAGMQGKVWIDESSMHPMRVECTVVTPVPVYGVLASVLPGTQIEIGMTPVTESIWLINEVSMKLNVSKIHMFKSSEVTRSTYSAFRLNSSALDELMAKASRE